MTKFIQGNSKVIGPVGSFSYDAECTYADLSSSLFSDQRGSPDYFLQQIKQKVSHDHICIARFVAVPRRLQRQGWGRKLFQELQNRLIIERATLAFLEVDPFIEWPESDELYAREIAWRVQLYASEGWKLLTNRSIDDEVLRVFMYSIPISASPNDTCDLEFSDTDEATHRRHQAESDNEYAH
jgi:GNAT superfamily N-acetyltransferase